MTPLDMAAYSQQHVTVCCDADVWLGIEWLIRLVLTVNQSLLFGMRIPRRENERQSLGRLTKGKATEWKLFHREERPALERNIIDTSEWTCANYRYVIG